MAIVVDSLFSRQSLRITEIINRSVTVFLAELDPIWRDLISTSQGVGNPNELGRDLKILKVFMGSFTGILEQGMTRADADLYGDATTAVGLQLHQQNIVQTYPDPTLAPNATPYRLAISMRSMVANIMLTLGEKTAEATPALIGQIIGPKLLGFGRMMAHTLANYFYLSQNSNYLLCTVTNLRDELGVAVSPLTGVEVEDGAYRFTFEPNNQSSNRFARGQRLDFYATASPPLNRKNDEQAADVNNTVDTRLECFVESVNHLHNVVTCVCPSATSNPNTGGDWQVAPTDTDEVFYANSKIFTGGTNAFTGIAGIRSWLKAGDGNPTTDSDENTLLGLDEADATDRINVDEHPEFMSFRKSVGGVLTEHKLRQYLRRCHSAWMPIGHQLDCLIASDGVWLAYEAQKIGMERLDRTGRLSNMNNEGSAEGFTFTFDGYTYKGYVSTLVESQTVYGLKKSNNNWKRYVPPSPAGTQKNPQTESYVPFEFVAGAITGSGSNQLPMYKTASGGGIGLVTEGSQLPGRLRMQLIPDVPNMMLLESVTEDRIYSDYDV